MSDKFAYRSPHNNLFLRFAYPQVKKEITKEENSKEKDEEVKEESNDNKNRG